MKKSARWSTGGFPLSGNTMSLWKRCLTAMWNRRTNIWTKSLSFVDRYVITSNRESGYGRYDILLKPKGEKNLPAIIIEFKVHHPRDGHPSDEGDLRVTVLAALKQTEEKCRFPDRRSLMLWWRLWKERLCGKLLRERNLPKGSLWKKRKKRKLQ